MCVLQVQVAEVGEGQSSWESVAEGVDLSAPTTHLTLEDGPS